METIKGILEKRLAECFAALARDDAPAAKRLLAEGLPQAAPPVDSANPVDREIWFRQYVQGLIGQPFGANSGRRANELSKVASQLQLLRAAVAIRDEDAGVFVDARGQLLVESLCLPWHDPQRIETLARSGQLLNAGNPEAEWQLCFLAAQAFLERGDHQKATEWLDQAPSLEAYSKLVSEMRHSIKVVRESL